MAKPKLRDLSRRELSADDYEAVVEELEKPDVPDMVAAILGATLVEHQVDQVIRVHLKHHDDSMWGRLTDPTGPLRDFSSKIVLGYAIGRYEADVAENLYIIKDIRNAFAHARTPLTFDQPTVRAALRKSVPIRYGKRTLRVATLAIAAEKREYLQLCFSSYLYFHLKFMDSIKRIERRTEAKRRELRFLQEFMASLEARKRTASGSGV